MSDTNTAVISVEGLSFSYDGPPVLRDATFSVPFPTTHICPAETSFAFHPHALGAGFHCGGDSALHSASECDPILNLICNSASE